VDGERLCPQPSLYARTDGVRKRWHGAAPAFPGLKIGRASDRIDRRGGGRALLGCFSNPDHGIPCRAA